MSDGADDPAVPGELAKYADYRDLDSAVDSELDHRAERHWRNDEHDDTGRAGAGDRHPGRRCDGDDREHSSPHGLRAAERSSADRRVGDCDADLRFDADHL